MELPQSCERGAEAVLNLQPNTSISIAYHPLFGPHNDLLLFEVDEKLIPEVLRQSVTVRGQPDEDAVFCTQSKTYAIKFVGNSNSVFIIPPINQSEYSQNLQDSVGEDNGRQEVASFIKVVPGNMELVEIAPKIDKLKILLSENPYRLEEEWEMEDEVENYIPGLYKWNDLINKVQASHDELVSGLQALSAVEIDGYWRIVDEKYMNSILQMLLHNSVLHDWSFDALNENAVISVLASDGFPHKLVHHCLQVFGLKVAENEENGCLWRLDEKHVCVHFSREILSKGAIKMETFMEEWKQKVPEGMKASFEMLEGEVLTERIGIETWVRAFRVSSLPSAPAERFSLLFKERLKWEWRDLQPYIRDLKVPGLSSEALLLKYTRRTQPNLDSEPISLQDSMPFITFYSLIYLLLCYKAYLKGMSTVRMSLLLYVSIIIYNSLNQFMLETKLHLRKNGLLYQLSGFMNISLQIC